MGAAADVNDRPAAEGSGRVMTLRARGVILIATFLACLGGGVAGAQDKPADTMELLREKARADKKLVVASALELTEGEAKVFWPVYNSYQSDMIAYYDRVSKLLDTFTETYGSMTDETAAKLLGDYLALQTDYVAILKSYAPKFRRVLPPVKVARLYQVENKMRALVDYELARAIPLIK
jgi:hypothetical protein